MCLVSHPISMIVTSSVKKDFSEILRPLGTHEVWHKYLGVGVNMSCGGDVWGLGSLVSQFSLSSSVALCV